MWTSGPSTAILGFQKTKQDDEGLSSVSKSNQIILLSIAGAYRCEIENEHGMVEHEFSLYVTGDIVFFVADFDILTYCIFSGGRHGLQSHVDEEEEAREESGGGEFSTFLDNN